MIFLYSGTPGSGKSLHAVSDMLQLDRKGWPIIANFKLNRDSIRNPDRFFYFDNPDLKPSALEGIASNYWRSLGVRVREDSILLVIDECQLIFNARDWQKNSAWISFFTQHRKLGFRVVLIAQDRGMIDKQIRSVLEYEYKHRKISNAGVFGVLSSIIVGSPFLYKKELAQVRGAGKGANLGFKVAHYGRRVYRAYDTFKTW